MDSAAYSGGVPDLRAQLARLERELRGTHRRFLVTRMGSSGSTWLAKLLNSHPEVFCYHEGVIAQVFPATSYTSDDVVTFIRGLCHDTMHRAYRAVGDVGSVGLGHIQALPDGLFTTGALLRHPARMLNTRLKVFKTDRSFTQIDPQYLRSIEETWGIQASKRDEMDQIFLQDLFHFCTLVKALDGFDVIIQLERMSAVEYCCDVLHRLTNRHHEPSLVQLFMNNPVNRRTSGNVSVKEILDGFSRDQRAWYRMALKDNVSQHGYALEDDECVDLRGPLAAVATDRTGDTAAKESPGYERQALKQVIADHGYERQALKQTIADHGYERQALKQTIADQERQIVHLQGFWSAVQNSAGWRVLEQWRRWRGLVLPVGTRRRRYYDLVLGSLRRTRTP